MTHADYETLPSDGDDIGDHEQSGNEEQEDTTYYYRLLGIPVTSSPSEIRQAFLQLSRRYHTDKHSLSTPAVQEAMRERFQQLTTAYTVLSDPRQRAAYDLNGVKGPGHLELVPRSEQSSQDIIDMVRALDRAAKLKKMERMLSSTSHCDINFSTIPLFRRVGRDAHAAVQAPDDEKSSGALLTEEHTSKTHLDSSDGSAGVMNTKIAEIEVNGKRLLVCIPDQDELLARMGPEIRQRLSRQNRRRTKPSTLAIAMKCCLPTRFFLQHTFEHSLSPHTYVKISGRASESEPPSIMTQWHRRAVEGVRESITSVALSMRKLLVTRSNFVCLSQIWSLKTKLSVVDGFSLLDMCKWTLTRKLYRDVELSNELILSLFQNGRFTTSIASRDSTVIAIAGAGYLSYGAMMTSKVHRSMECESTRETARRRGSDHSGIFTYSLYSQPLTGVSTLSWKYFFHCSKYFDLGIEFGLTLPYSFNLLAPPYFIVQSVTIPTTVHTVSFVYNRGRHKISIPVAVFASESLTRSVMWLSAPLILMRMGVLLYQPLARLHASRHYAKRRAEHITELDISRQNALLEQEAIKDSVAHSRALEERRSGLVILQATYGVLRKEYSERAEAESPSSPTIDLCVERPPLLTYYTNAAIQWMYRRIFPRVLNSKEFPVNGIHEASEEADDDIPLFLDVTVALQNLVRESSLGLPTGTKSTLTGFYDPDPYTPERKILKVVYAFRGRRHVAVFNDEDEVLIPQREHLQEERV